MGCCSENISPGHGSQIGLHDDISNMCSAENLPKVPPVWHLVPLALPPSPGWHYSQRGTLNSEIPNISSGRKWTLTLGRLSSYCDYCGVVLLWDIKSKYIWNCILARSGNSLHRGWAIWMKPRMTLFSQKILQKWYCNNTVGMISGVFIEPFKISTKRFFWIVFLSCN